MLDPNPSSFPELNHLNDLLDLTWGSEVNEIMDSQLLSPLRDFLKRPGKKIRGKMVEIGFELASGKDLSKRTPFENQTLERASELLEFLHSASLIIDDIQDNSEERRGEPTVHRKYGMPLALNAGNWLYFWPLQNVETWGVSDSVRLNVYRICHRGLLRAHFGQALDVGLNIFETPQNKMKATCLASLELKSGALMAMALALGVVLGEGTQDLELKCQKFGHAFGIALQMFDDSGNASIAGPKQFEDLKLKRPSWLVATAAEALSLQEFGEFADAVGELPQTMRIQKVLEKYALIEKARNEAKQYLSHALGILDEDCFQNREKPVQRIYELADLLVRAYV